MKTPQIILGQFFEKNDGSLRGEIGTWGRKTMDVGSVEMEAKETGKKYLKLMADPDGEPHQIGVAFPIKKDQKDYWFVKLDSPLFDKPVHAALFKDRDSVGVLNLVLSNRSDEPRNNAEAPSNKRQFVGANAAPTV